MRPHENLEVWKKSVDMVIDIYEITKEFPSDEKFAMMQQIRRAALSVHLNIAEGCSRTSEKERKRFYEIARGSIIEIDTAMELAVNLKFIEKTKLENLGSLLIRIFQMLSKMIN